jgi:hypothetical protein
VPDDQIPKSSRAPALGKRLAWWFGIYIVAQLPLIFSGVPFWAFPMGLAALFLLGLSGPDFSNWLAPFGYTLYVCHLALSLIVKSKRVFLFLMIILIIMVSLNLYSCEVLPTLGRVP